MPGQACARARSARGSAPAAAEVAAAAVVAEEVVAEAAAAVAEEVEVEAAAEWRRRRRRWRRPYRAAQPEDLVWRLRVDVAAVRVVPSTPFETAAAAADRAPKCGACVRLDRAVDPPPLSVAEVLVHLHRDPVRPRLQRERRREVDHEVAVRVRHRLLETLVEQRVRQVRGRVRVEADVHARRTPGVEIDPVNVHSGDVPLGCGDDEVVGQLSVEEIEVPVLRVRRELTGVVVLVVEDTAERRRTCLIAVTRIHRPEEDAQGQRRNAERAEQAKKAPHVLLYRVTVRTDFLPEEGAWLPAVTLGGGWSSRGS